MENAVLKEQSLEALFSKLIAGDLAENAKNMAGEEDHCFILCKKIAPNVFFIKNGLAIIDESKNVFRRDAFSAKCLTKLIFLSQ